MNNTPYDNLVQKFATQHGNPPDLLWGQIYHESGFNARARGYNRDAQGHVLSIDRGIAQINNVAHPEVSDSEADNPIFAINWMAEVMIAHYEQYKNWEEALVAYNAGHYVASDIGYATAVIEAAKLSPFINDPHSYTKGYENPNPTPGPVNYPTIRFGSHGGYVKLAQELLAKHGCRLSVDGNFGNDTETAVRDFEAQKHITIDGIIGPAVWKLLLE